MKRAGPAFYATLREWRDRPFGWQDATCCHFAEACVRAQGVPLPYETPTLQGPQEAAEWLRAETGARSLFDLLRRLFGAPVKSGKAMRGDLALRPGGIEAGALGVFDRDAWFISEKGLIAVPRSEVRWAFSLDKLRILE